jgi:hypothetical protein
VGVTDDEARYVRLKELAAARPTPSTLSTTKDTG